MDEQQPVLKRRGRPPGVKPEQDLNVQPVETGGEFKRVYSSQQMLDHDLYYLKVASLKHNVSYNDDTPIWESKEHSHYYHSVDSRGRKQEFCNKIGGHFHQVTVNADGTAHCSPALREVKIRRNGRTTTQYVPVPGDTHTHQLEYRGSEKFKPVGINSEWAKVQSNIANYESRVATTKVPDVVEND